LKAEAANNDSDRACNMKEQHFKDFKAKKGA